MANITKNNRFRFAFWGIVLVLGAVALILSSAGVNFGVELSAWRIVGGVFLLAWLIYTCIKLKFTDVFFPLAFLFLVFEGPIANAMGRPDGKLVSTWIVLLAALMLTIGTKAIFSKHGPVHVEKGVKPNPDNDHSGRFGNTTVYFDAADLSGAVVRENLGNIHVYFSNKDAYTGGGSVTITENLGQVTLHLPTEWEAVVTASENLGKVSVPDKGAAGAGARKLDLVVTENLGHVTVVYE